MSTPRRKGAALPPWLTSTPIAAFARAKNRAGKSVSDRVIVAVTVRQRAGLDAITALAKRAGLPAGSLEPTIVRIALDRLLDDFERWQAEPSASPNTGSPSDAPMREDGES